MTLGLPRACSSFIHSTTFSTSGLAWDSLYVFLICARMGGQAGCGRVGGCMRAAGLRGAGQWAGGRPGAQLPPAIKHQQEDCWPLHASDSDGDRGGRDTAHPAQQGQRSAPGTA